MRGLLVGLGVRLVGLGVRLTLGLGVAVGAGVSNRADVVASSLLGRGTANAAEGNSRAAMTMENREIRDRVSVQASG